MGPETRVLLNSGQFVLPNLIREKKHYPPLDEVLADVREVTKEVVLVDGSDVLKKAGYVRALNIFMLGTLMALGWLPFDDSFLWPAVERRCGPRHLDANCKAFALGRSSVIEKKHQSNSCTASSRGRDEK
jgi:Pyruvate/2-oxoacid:ferredoxin oxidoreductase gamma subunit